jgi:hypothetical protein
MKNTSRSVQRKVLFTACFLLIILTIQCWSLPLQSDSPIQAPDSFPSSEIVFSDFTEREVGFIDPDSYDKSMIPVSIGHSGIEYSWENPRITSDGQFLFVLYTYNPGMEGRVYALHVGEMPLDCGWDGTLQLTLDGLYVLVNSGAEIEKYRPSDCGTANRPEIVYENVSSYFDVLSPDEQYLAYSKQGLLFIRQLSTGVERYVGDGIFPSWSRDGKMLAFTGADGVYVINNAEGETPNCLVPLEKPDPDYKYLVYDYIPMIGYYPPIASWSPDGKWVVYHVYSQIMDGANLDVDYSIFKVNVETGETFKIVDGGYSPYWRWPAQP